MTKPCKPASPSSPASPRPSFRASGDDARHGLSSPSRHRRVIPVTLKGCRIKPGDAGDAGDDSEAD